MTRQPLAPAPPHFHASILDAKRGSFKVSSFALSHADATAQLNLWLEGPYRRYARNPYQQRAVIRPCRATCTAG